MTDEEYESQKKRFTEIAKSWRHILGLGWWNITYHFERNLPDPFDHPSNAVMWVTPDWRYMMASLTVCVPNILDLDDEELEYCILHEYGHIFVNELRNSTGEDYSNHEERVATTLGYSWQWIRQHYTEPEEEEEQRQEEAS